MNTFLLTLASGLLLASGAAPSSQTVAIRVGKAETISQGTLEHAVILVEGGKITAIGEDLPIERGIPILERPSWVVTPGLVNCYSRLGLDSQAGREVEPHVRASAELYPRSGVYGAVLEKGVTTLGLYPPGTGIPGQAVAVKPKGATAEEMTLADGVYLKVNLEADPRSKKDFLKGFEDVDEHEEKVAKAREKWEKEQEKSKKKSKKKDDDKDEEKKEGDDKDEGSKEFTPPEPDAKVKPFIDLRAKTLAAMMSIRKAGDFLHVLDVLKDEDVDWFLRVRLRHDIDLYEVADQIGERELAVVVEPLLTLRPNTRRLRNLPAELDRAGAKVALIPSDDSVEGHEDWPKEVGQIVAEGFDRDAALAGMTLEPARLLRLGERLGSLDVGKDANLVFWDGDPFQPATEVQAVMLEGEFVHGDIEL